MRRYVTRLSKRIKMSLFRGHGTLDYIYFTGTSTEVLCRVELVLCRLTIFTTDSVKGM